MSVTTEDIGSSEQTDPASADGAVEAMMSTPIVAVVAATPLGDVLHVMLRMGRRHVVVLGDQGRCLGILGDRAVAAAWAADPSALSRIRAGQLLETTASVVPRQASVQEVATVMTRDQVDAVAVVNAAGEPLGIVTGSDLVALMARTWLPGPAATAPITE